MTEKEIIEKLAPRFQAKGGRIWRTVPGLLWKGKLLSKSKTGSSVVLGNSPTPVKLFSIGEPDCHFYVQKTITQDMVGEKVLLFGKIEIKTKKYKTLSKEQLEKLRLIDRKCGGAFVVLETDDGVKWYTIDGWVEEFGE